MLNIKGAKCVCDAYLCVYVCVKAVIIWGRVNVMSSDRIVFVFWGKCFTAELVIQILNIFLLDMQYI